MKRFLAPILLVSLVSLVFAQDYNKRPTEAQMQKHWARMVITEPPYGLAKIKRLIKHLKSDSEGNEALPQKQFEALSFDEKFTYVMLHGERFVQNCDPMPSIENEDKKIFAHQLGGFAEDTAWSPRQQDFARRHRAQFIAKLRGLIRTRKVVGLNVRYAADELNAYELAPDLLAAYARRSDNEILTVLMNMMHSAQYEPFLRSQIYRQLYSEDSSVWTSIPSTSANRNRIIGLAKGFVKSRKRGA